MTADHTTLTETPTGVGGAAVRLMQRIAALGPLGRNGVPYLFDITCWAFALLIFTVLRFDFNAAKVSWATLALVWAMLAVVQLLLGLATSVYRSRFRYGTFEEAITLTVVGLGTGAIVGIIVLVAAPLFSVPRSVVFFATPLAIVGMLGLRFFKRALVSRYLRPHIKRTTRTLIYGAGYTGSDLARRIVSDIRSPYELVGFIDDDPRKRNLMIGRSRVLGSRAQAAGIIEREQVDVIVVAISRANSALLRSIADAVAGTGARIQVLPSLEEILRSGTTPSSLRDIEIADLIGRSAVETDLDAVAGYISGARVLVTGAGGSIGSELAVQLSRFKPSRLVLLDRDESGLQATQISLTGHGLLDSEDLVLADIRDASSLVDVFAQIQPEVVFHAAALKHLSLLEQYPREAWKTNVLGTWNVLSAARAAGVTTFVNISTDKAANPTSVLGHSKRLAEKLTAWMAERAGNKYVSVRFGNVIGSRGSMLPTFTRLIESGGPVTVTHPDVTRFFMTIPEACQLVIQAGAIGRPGEVLILDMGEPVRIADIAQRMIASSGKDVAIVYTGLRPGEKLHEELVGEGEDDSRPFHPLVSHATISTLSVDDLDESQWLGRMTAEPRLNDTMSLPRLQGVTTNKKDA